MRSIEVALAADYARRGQWIIPVILLTITSLPMWLFAAFSQDGVLAPAAHEAVALHVTLTLIMGFGAAIAVFQALGKQARHFIRPISAARLVACQMLFGALTIAGMYLIAASVLNLGGVGWPLVGPALFLAATLACSLAAIWTLEGSVVGQLLGCIAVAVPLTFWFSRCYGAQSFGDWKEMWSNPTVSDALSLGGLMVAAYGVAVVGVSRVRRGDAWDFAALRQWWERQFSSNATACTFANPQLAQGWFEWRQKLTIVPPILVSCFLVFMAALWAFDLLPMKEFLEVARTLPLVVLMSVLPLILGLVAGNCGQESGKTGMRFVLATRPVTDTFLAMAILRNCVACLLWSWGTLLIGYVAIAGVLYWSGYREDVLRVVWPQGSTVQQFALTGLIVGLISWTFTSLMATLVAAGRPWLIVCLLALFFGLLITFALLRQWLADSYYEPLATSWKLFSGILFLGLTVAMFIAALRQRLIGVLVVVPCVAFWLALSSVVTFVNWPSSLNQPTFVSQCIGLFSLSVLPMAGMPLAVRWNRHR